jgi:hypothetical protein
MQIVKRLFSRGTVPQEWRDRLELMRRAAGNDPSRTPIVADAKRFIDRWGPRAARLGWSADLLFGTNPPDDPFADYSGFGLVWLIGGGRVLALPACSALPNAGGTAAPGGDTYGGGFGVTYGGVRGTGKGCLPSPWIWPAAGGFILREPVAARQIPPCQCRLGRSAPSGYRGASCPEVGGLLHLGLVRRANGR